MKKLLSVPVMETFVFERLRAGVVLYSNLHSRHIPSEPLKAEK